MEDVSCVTVFFSVWFNVVFSGFGIYRYLIHIFLLNNWCPGQGAVCGGCGVMAIKIFDLDVKFEVPIRHTGEDIKWESVFLELNAKNKKKRK